MTNLNFQNKPDDLLELAIRQLKKQSFDDVKNIASSLIKQNHLNHIFKLVTIIIGQPLSLESSKLIISIAKLLNDNNQTELIKKIVLKLQTITTKNSQKIQKKINDMADSKNPTPDSPPEKINLDVIDVGKMASDHGSKTGSINSDVVSSEIIVTDDQKESFKSFYHSFLNDKIKSLVVACEKQSQLGKYYIHITKQVIDFRKIEAASEKKFLYDFTTGLVKVNGQPMDEHFVSKFYKMMEQVSKDVKHNKAQLLQEKK